MGNKSAAIRKPKLIIFDLSEYGDVHWYSDASNLPTRLGYIGNNYIHKKYKGYIMPMIWYVRQWINCRCNYFINIWTI